MDSSNRTVATLGISLRLAINGGKYDAVEQRDTARSIHSGIVAKCSSHDRA